jgi:hypothetical protein
MINLPEDYVISKFFQYNYAPKHNTYNNTYQGGCCICKEGDSFGKKKRCYYIPENNNIFCHNCGWSSTPLTWIREVSGKTIAEIIEEVGDCDIKVDILEEITKSTYTTPPRPTNTLPENSINLFDKAQLSYYKDNDIVKQCLQVIRDRMLDVACNRPDSLYVSLTDKVHRNRIIIPFFNEHRDIEFYQTRGVLEKELKTRPKYVSKINAEKTLFNIDKISGDYDSVYIFEGPINAFFVKNSVAVAGITDRGSHMFTKKQQHQIDTTLRLFDKVWVLDSQWIDKASLKKSEILLRNNQNVFIWPENFGKHFKDFNDICILTNRNEINHEFIKKNTFKGLEGVLRLSNIKSKVS